MRIGTAQYTKHQSIMALCESASVRCGGCARTLPFEFLVDIRDRRDWEPKLFRVLPLISEWILPGMSSFRVDTARFIFIPFFFFFFFFFFLLPSLEAALSWGKSAVGVGMAAGGGGEGVLVTWRRKWS